jgi:hypothetical protein
VVVENVTAHDSVAITLRRDGGYALAADRQSTNTTAAGSLH